MNSNNAHHKILNTIKGLREVNNPIRPVSSFQSAPGFFNIAHRGASFNAPENTMPAFQMALEMGADMIEFDVTLTRDQIPVVIHDQTLDRTTSGKGGIQQYLSRELSELDAGIWFSKSFENTRIPTLEQILNWAFGKIALNIEIKKEAFIKDKESGIVEFISELVLEYDMAEHVIISSFSAEALIRCRKVMPKIPTAYLISPYSWGSRRNLRLMKKLSASGLNLKHKQMRPSLMKQAKSERLPIWVYTVDDEEEMKKVIEKGATGIFTNRPDILNEVASSTLTRQ